ncbi:hypothetical protein LTR56_007061 [Elasticomyces elasticus]|nr:hypothetical protein LTR56_007061 [Elasticomyces elasticus]KAK3664069.1 hypothetical protein LTR22_005033 [Elasticomyces elasticus]KAK4927638.1 hypothetical protein LTR49_005507 [Elasticomyces elasticus]KAK5767010.1 hypothetical protein LTS12_002775 [Elasticomyces elasticus]
METSPLNNLPGELRTQIYELALSWSSPLIITSYPTSRRAKTKYVLGTKAYHGEDLARHLQALTTTCKQIYHEASSIIFRCNDFRLDVHHSTFSDRVGEWKKVRILANRLITAIRPERGNIPRALEVSFGSLDIEVRNPAERATLKASKVVLRDLRNIATSLPGCDVRILVSVSMDRCYAGHDGGGACTWGDYDCIMTVHVQTVAASLATFAAQIRQQVQAGPDQPGFHPLMVDRLEKILQNLTDYLESDGATPNVPQSSMSIEVPGSSELSTAWSAQHPVPTAIVDDECVAPSEAGSGMAFRSQLAHASRTGRARSFLDKHAAVTADATGLGDDAAFAVAMAGLSMQRISVVAHE